METTTLFFSQLTDVFRIGLLTALMYTTENTRAHTGLVIPLLAGIVFVAVIIPVTMPVAGVPTLQAITTGIVANACLMAVIWIIWNTARKALQK